MRAFIDFEASSLGRHGYPIEVAWIFEDGRSASYLIQPVDAWTDWDPAAEEIHGISRGQLSDEGAPAPSVAQYLLDALAGHQVFASAPSWDGKWMSMLLRSGGLPRHAIRVSDTDKALLELGTALLTPSVPSPEIHRAVRKIIARVSERFSHEKPAHRALPDAIRERERWLMVSELAHAHMQRS